MVLVPRHVAIHARNQHSAASADKGDVYLATFIVPTSFPLLRYPPLGELRSNYDGSSQAINATERGTAKTDDTSQDLPTG